MMTSRGLRRKIDSETGWKIGDGLKVDGRLCLPERPAFMRKADAGKIGYLSIHFNENGDRLRLYAYDPSSSQTLVEIILDAEAFEAALAKARQAPAKRVSQGLLSTKINPPSSAEALTALELERGLSPKEAAKLLGISVDTFNRHYRHLVQKASTRRTFIRLRDLLKARDKGF